MRSLCWSCFCCLLLLVTYGQAGTMLGFYDRSCPPADFIIRSAFRFHLSADSTIAPAILRLHFHDCFIRGCDASILIDGPSAEKTAPANGGLRGFDVIEDIKARVEAACPGVVSCADILAVAAREAVSQSGGPSWPVPLGRRDGTVSLASDASNMPSPFDSVATLKQKFFNKGLSAMDLVALSGAHTIGQTDCQFFSYRLYKFNSTRGADPSMSAGALSRLQQLCPSSRPTNRVALDIGSGDLFDDSYYKNLLQGNGILGSDQKLSDDSSTSMFVRAFSIGAFGGITFKAGFIKGMMRMAEIQVKTGSEGEIRKQCSAFN